MEPGIPACGLATLPYLALLPFGLSRGAASRRRLLRYADPRTCPAGRMHLLMFSRRSLIEIHDTTLMSRGPVCIQVLYPDTEYTPTAG
ncbi:hypothetical protein B0T25DRAFT_553240 [Lasiosphaeria hispida]|uniref:Uncharacterized protein n=1 Tax=Lasiosphaeria hispida TaxID=260671 RepID=A0AAJ0HC88_9PEZI|nr:hypothetical protein B0T25DRAFT_553240 [Lasiosphaeria hispida]